MICRNQKIQRRNRWRGKCLYFRPVRNIAAEHDMNGRVNRQIWRNNSVETKNFGKLRMICIRFEIKQGTNNHSFTMVCFLSTSFTPNYLSKARIYLLNVAVIFSNRSLCAHNNQGLEVLGCILHFFLTFLDDAFLAENMFQQNVNLNLLYN